MISLVERCVDLMLPVHNRADYTRECLYALVQNTSWKYVRKFTVYDVGSTDGSRQVIEGILPELKGKVETEIIALPKAPVIEIQNYHVLHSVAPLIAKIDNDAVMPPRWLDVALSVIGRHSDLYVLGLEAMTFLPETSMDPDDYGITDTMNTDGIFLARASAFSGVPLPAVRTQYFDFWEWQKSIIPHLKKGWLKPSIPMFLLDRVPFDPWVTLGKMYIEKGWQRPWQLYPSDCALFQWKWPSTAEKKSPTPVPSVQPIVMPSSQPGLKVDLGTSDKPPEGFDFYVDVVPSPSVPADKMKVADLRDRWPFQTSSVSHFRAHDIIEHLPDKIHTMNEIFRCLKDGGTAEILVPTIEGVGSVSDPQHCSYWSRASFDYFTYTHFAYRRFAKAYGITAAFEVGSEEKIRREYPFPSGPETVVHLKVMLSARKPSVTSCSVVIPSNDALHLRHSVDQFLKAHLDFPPSSIIVVDDGAKKDWTVQDPQVTWVEGVSPFVYARNVNLGLKVVPEGNDVFLMGDDCQVNTPDLISRLGDCCHTFGNTPFKAAAISAGITGPVGNPEQVYRKNGSIAECGARWLAFVSVYLSAQALSSIGNLDERFIGYGSEDRDWCKRAIDAGWKLYAHQGVEVVHNPPGMASTFRTKPDITNLHEQNKQLYEEKWASRA